jgi:hypothetical protein
MDKPYYKLPGFVEVYEASDYAGLVIGGLFECYYGYEEVWERVPEEKADLIEEDWCFVVRHRPPGAQARTYLYRLPFSAMQKLNPKLSKFCCRFLAQVKLILPSETEGGRWWDGARSS